jgi:hypothetical protein
MRTRPSKHDPGDYYFSKTKAETKSVSEEPKQGEQVLISAVINVAQSTLLAGFPSTVTNVYMLRHQLSMYVSLFILQDNMNIFVVFHNLLRNISSCMIFGIKFASTQ